MAVAGGTVPAYLLRLDGSRLVVVGGQQLIAKSVTEDSPTDAVATLRRGKSVYLRAVGSNLAQVEAMLKEKI